jgi:hypothetical protein
MDAHAQQYDPRDAPFIITRTTTPWGEPLLAGLPHIWVGVSLAVGKLSSTTGQAAGNNYFNLLSMASLTIFALVCLAVTVYAWLRSWPLWTASWYSYTAWLLLIPIGLATVFFVGSSAVNNVMVISALAVLLLGYLILFRASRLHALLVALFILPVLPQVNLEAIPVGIEAFLSMFFGLLAALVAIMVLRWWSWQAGVTLALGANLIAGATLAFISFYQTDPANFYGSSTADVWLFFVIYLIISILLFIGPALFWSLWKRPSSSTSSRV